MIERNDAVLEIIGDAEGFVSRVNGLLLASDITPQELGICDHLCYRVEDMDSYTRLSQRLADVSTMIGEVEVAGRPISTFELKEPLEIGGWRIPCLELPAPKDGSEYIEGLEHAEFVVLGSLDKFAARHEELRFSFGGMKKDINPELGLKGEQAAVKFHEIPLGAVVRLEERLAATRSA